MEQSCLCSLLGSSSLEIGEAASTRVCVQAHGYYKNTLLNTSQLGFGSACMPPKNKPGNKCILQPSLVEMVQLRHNTEKDSFVLDLPRMCTEHGLNGGSHSQKAPIALREGEAPSVRGCHHAWCSLATGGGTADLPRVRSVWVSRRSPSGSCTEKEAAMRNRDLQHRHRQEKFGLGLENRWKAALLLCVEVNINLFKIHLCSWSENGFFLSVVNSSSLQTSDLTALRTKEPVLYSTVDFYDFIFISMQCHKSI